MFRVLTATLIALTLTGCMDSITQLPEPTDKSYYTVDLKDFSYCQGNDQDCMNLSSISTGHSYFGAIEEVYGQKLTGPNYRGNLLRMLLKPKNAEYPVEKTSKDGRYYKVPANKYTDTVWNTLNRIDTSLYSPKNLDD
ncbi:MAG: hypothetical protein KBT66_15180 [Amphritea sp.]|nr:hypothetical protein [Amphritea sp.]MBQ0785569.1 hypothetical protein [Amphritea sp.]